MKILVNTNSKVVIDIGENIIETEAGYEVVRGIQSTIYPFADDLASYEVDVPAGVVFGKYCYEPDKSFYLNTTYVEYIPTEERLLQLQQQVNDLNQAMAAIMGGAV